VKLECGSVTSSNLTELASFGRGRVPPNGNEFTWATTASNKHVKYFNSDNHGCNVVDSLETHCCAQWWAFSSKTRARKPTASR
jgi:hypothetical protein